MSLHSKLLKQAAKTAAMRHLVLYGVMLLSLAAIAALLSPKVYADQPVTDAVQVHCNNLDLPKSVLAGCTDANINHARNVATFHCNPKASSADKVKCVEKIAKGYLTSVTRSKNKPDSPKEFRNVLENILQDNLPKSAKGNLDKRAEGFDSGNGGSLDPAGDLTNCTDGKCSDPAADPNVDCDRQGCDFIKKYVNPGINLLSITFGLIAVGSLIFGGIQYTTSAGEPQKVSQAKQRIINTIVAIVAYFFLFGFLQFLIPGGLFK